MSKKKKISPQAIKENPELAKAEAPEAEEAKSGREEPTAERLAERLLFKAYHGNRETERAVQGVTGSQLNAAIIASVLKEQNIYFTEAEARDGTIIRAFNKFGDEECRVFLSYKGKYEGMFGVSGKVRALMEVSMPQAEFLWQQQGSKNYYFSGNTAALLQFLGA